MSTCCWEPFSAFKTGAPSVEIPAAQARHGNWQFPCGAAGIKIAPGDLVKTGPALCSSESWPVTTEGLLVCTVLGYRKTP